jgi:hypothetical protein
MSVFASPQKKQGGPGTVWTIVSSASASNFVDERHADRRL